MDRNRNRITKKCNPVSVSVFPTVTGTFLTGNRFGNPGITRVPPFYYSLFPGWKMTDPSFRHNNPRTPAPPEFGSEVFFSRAWCKPSPSGVPLVPPLGSGSTVTPHKGPHGWGWVPVLKIEITVPKWHLAGYASVFGFCLWFTVAFVETETDTGKIIKIPKPVSWHCSGRRTRNRNREQKNPIHLICFGFGSPSRLVIPEHCSSS